MPYTKPDAPFRRLLRGGLNKVCLRLWYKKCYFTLTFILVYVKKVPEYGKKPRRTPRRA